MWSIGLSNIVGAGSAGVAACATYIICKAANVDEKVAVGLSTAAAVVGEGLGSYAVNAAMQDAAGTCETSVRLIRKACATAAGVPPIPGV